MIIYLFIYFHWFLSSLFSGASVTYLEIREETNKKKKMNKWIIEWIKARTKTSKTTQFEFNFETVDTKTSLKVRRYGGYSWLMKIICIIPFDYNYRMVQDYF